MNEEKRDMSFVEDLFVNHQTIASILTIIISMVCIVGYMTAGIHKELREIRDDRMVSNAQLKDLREDRAAINVRIDHLYQICVEMLKERP
jgi:hypothetical protein